MRTLKIGVLSDTHGLLRPETLAALEGCEAILHGGDVDTRRVLDRLAEIAPVYAVRGNNDGDWAAALPTLLEATLAGTRIVMAHRKKDLPRDLSGYDLAVYGHTHQYAEARSGRTLLLNPGSCGPRRFRLPVTLATAELSEGQISVRRVELAATVPAPNVSGADMKRQIELVMRETARGRGPGEIARRYHMDAALAQQIARLYVTHPGVTAEGIMTKMGL